MKKKSFAYGYSMIVNWFIVWALLNFLTTASVSIYREAIASLRGFDSAFLLEVTSYASLVCSFLVLVLPKIMTLISAKMVVVIGIICAGVIYMLMPFAPNQLIFALMIGVEVLCGMLYASIGSMVMVSKWFPRTKGTVMGIITGSGILSSALFLPIFRTVNANFGITAAMLVIGAMVTVFGIVCIFWLKEAPEDVGLMPDNKPMTEEEKEVLAVAANQKSNWSYGQLLKNWRIWFVGLGWGIVLMAVGGLALIVVTYFDTKGISYSTSLNAITIAGYMTVVGSWISGIIDDKFGTRIMCSLVGLAYAVVFIAMGAITGGPAILYIAGYVIMATLSGAANNLFSSQILSLFGPKGFSTALTLGTLIMAIRNLGTFVDAQFLRYTGSYDGAILFFGILSVVATVMIFLAGDKFIEHSSETAEG